MESYSAAFAPNPNPTCPTKIRRHPNVATRLRKRPSGAVKNSNALDTSQSYKPIHADERTITMPDTTLVVNISPELAPELEQWLSEHNANSHPWNLVLGSEGYLQITDHEQSIVHEAAYLLAARRADLVMTPWPELNHAQRTSLLQHGADSWSYMHEGYFEDHEVADLVDQAELLAADVPNDTIVEPVGMISQLRDAHNISLPDWDNLSQHRRSYLRYLERASTTWAANRRITSSEAAPLFRSKSD